MSVPKGYELVEEIPQGYEVVNEPDEPGIMDTIGGVANIAAAAGVGVGKQALTGLHELGGLIMGRGVDASIAEAEATVGQIPDVPLGESAQNIITSLSEKYQAAPEIIKDIVSSFANSGENLAEATFQGTGSPLLAAGARIVPDAMEAAMGGSLLRSTPKAVAKVAATAEQVPPIAKAALTYQGPKKQRIAELLQGKNPDIDTAKFKLKPPKVVPSQVGDMPRLEAPSAQKAIPQGRVGKFIATAGAPKVKADKVARESIKQGFKEGVVAEIKVASPIDKKKMLKMVNLMEGGKRQALKGFDERPSDVAGDSLASLIKNVHTTNRSAGKRLDVVAKGLRGKVDHETAVNSFVSDLAEMGITVSKGLKLGFKGSDIEGLAGPIRVISQTFNRLKETKAPSAYDVHRMKKFIDEQVTYGKSAEGLGGKAEGILKSLRHNLDGLLDKKFPEYDKVNKTYSETIQALNAMQDAAGRKMNFKGPNADKAIGVLMRRLMSKTPSRIPLMDAVKEIKGLAKKYGGPDAGDLRMQALFVDELDVVFGDAARTSFRGEIQSSVKGAANAAIRPADALINTIAKGAEKARGINEENAFKAIRKLLEN